MCVEVKGQLISSHVNRLGSSCRYTLSPHMGWILYFLNFILFFMCMDVQPIVCLVPEEARRGR